MRCAARLVPINHRYPFAEVMAAVREYVARTNRRVTFEYALMNGINDSLAVARQLAGLLRGLRNPTTGAILCHVNLIPLNPVAESPYQPSTPERATAFQALLEAGRHPRHPAHTPRDRHRCRLRSAPPASSRQRSREMRCFDWRFATAHVVS